MGCLERNPAPVNQNKPGAGRCVPRKSYGVQIRFRAAATPAT
jgi:hypothetical protein